MSRLLAAALRNDLPQTTPSYNAELLEQLAASVGRAGEIDLHALLARVSARYDSLDDERRGVVLSMQLMADEAQALTRAMRLGTASRLEAILDFVDDAVIGLDELGRIQSLNPAGGRIFGYAPREVIGAPLDLLLPDAPSAPAAPGPLIGFLDECAAAADDLHRGPALHEITGRARNGGALALEMSVSWAGPGRRSGYVVCVRDVSDRQRAALIAAGERRMVEALAARASLATVLLAIARTIEQVLPQAHCAIDLLDLGSQRLRHAVAPTLPRAFVAAMDGSPVGLESGSSAAVVFLGHRIAAADVSTDPTWQTRAAIAAHAGLRSVWVEPIARVDGVTLGTVAVYRRLPGLPRTGDVTWLSRLAQIAAIAIERRAHPSPAVRGREAAQRFQAGSTMFSSGNRAVIRVPADGT